MLRFLNESWMFSGFRQTGPLWLPLLRRVKYTCIVTYSGIFSRLLLEDCGWRSHTVVRLAHCGCFLSGSGDKIVLLATFSRCYFVWLAHCGCFLSGSGDEIVLQLSHGVILSDWPIVVTFQVYLLQLPDLRLSSDWSTVVASLQKSEVYTCI